MGQQLHSTAEGDPPKARQSPSVESSGLSVPKSYRDTGFMDYSPTNPTQENICWYRSFMETAGHWLILNRRDPNVVINTAIKINIAYQLVFALKAIHDKGILLNDNKFNNDLVDTSTHDFQISNSKLFKFYKTVQ
ncbi:uncharacterized protein LOC117342573 [Pecten maximus]|uniref:uncharacterized protein LOC117342573 n=1 Tax=Pecten maximus TaxID=6579 RepID=UPI0014589612|nr:uncharacterized protein LOC117342573 [Pecten maximus]